MTSFLCFLVAFYEFSVIILIVKINSSCVVNYVKITLPDSVNEILNKLNAEGFEAFIVGGCVRDSLLGLVPKDWDITTNALPQDISRCFCDYKQIDVGAKHGTIGVLIDNSVYEITTYRIDGDYKDCRHPENVTFSSNLESDLARRDFTINAMAYSPKTGLIDIFGGEKDLNNKAVCCVGNPDLRFKEDALRILRGLRFASVYNFSIEFNTANAILSNSKLLSNISSERISDEFTKLICGESAAYILNRFRRVISVFIPEIEVMFHFDQNNPHHNKTLWRHTMSALSHIEPDPVLRLTMFFHDIGKPLAQSYDEVKRLCHYKGHNRFSAAITETVLKRLKYPNDIIDRVKTLIIYHDVRFSDSKRQIKHVMSAIGKENFQLLMSVQKADILAQSMYKREEKLNNFRLFSDAYAEILENNECFTLKDLALNGHDLIHLGILKGEDIGKTLRLLLSLVIDGKLENNKEQLIIRAKEINNL